MSLGAAIFGALNVTYLKKWSQQALGAPIFGALNIDNNSNPHVHFQWKLFLSSFKYIVL